MVTDRPTIEVIAAEPDAEKNAQKVLVKGEIDRDTIEEFRQKMDEAINNFQQTHLILDLENLTFINSEGIGYISDVQNRLSTQNKHVYIIKATERILDIMQLVGLNQIVPCYATEEECIQALT